MLVEASSRHNVCAADRGPMRARAPGAAPCMTWRADRRRRQCSKPAVKPAMRSSPIHRVERIVGHVKPCNSASSPLVTRPDTTQFVTAEEAAKQIPDGATLVLAGFVGCSCPESVLDALRARYDATSSPRALTLVWGISSGDKKQRGFGVLAKEGLLKRIIYAWTASAPQFVPLVKNGQV